MSADSRNEGEPAEILLVEDSPADAELTVRALQKRRIANRIHHVIDGAEAIAYVRGLARADFPSVVLLDLKLPRVDGLEVLEELKSDPSMRTIPVVVLTSSNENRDLERAYELGANSYIVKPVEFEDFERCVEELGMYWAVLNQTKRT